jgi:hypothetical protein
LEVQLVRRCRQGVLGKECRQCKGLGALERKPKGQERGSWRGRLEHCLPARSGVTGQEAIELVF